MSPERTDIAVRCRGLVKRYADVTAVDGLDLEVRARRVLRPARPQRRRQDDHDRDPRRADSTPTPARSRCSARRWDARRDASCASGIGISLQETQLSEKLTVRETRAPLPLASTARAAIPTRCSRSVVARGEARRARRQALRRAEAAAGRRLRAGRRPGAAVPRRADDRPRSAVAAAALGASSTDFRAARRHGAADHPLHGRGRAAVRPRGDRRSRQGDRPRHAGRADRSLGGERHRVRLPSRRSPEAEPARACPA